MADVTKVQASDGTIYTINDEDDYTKDEIDAMLADKADVGASYTKAEDDALLTGKADKTDVDDALLLKADKDTTYTKTEVDNLLDTKAGVGDSYTKAEDDALLDAKADKTDVDDALLLKADKADTYTKSEADALLADKADVGDSYTKAEDDALLADKADSTDVYTKAEVDALIGGIKMFPRLDWGNPIHTFNDGATYTATEDCWLCGFVIHEYGGDVSISINGKVIYKSPVAWTNSTSGGQTGFNVTPTLIKTGDIVTVSDNVALFRYLYILKEV